MLRLRFYPLIVLVLTLPGATAGAQTREPQRSELKKLSIEELSELDVTTVSRRTERLSRTAAAVSVVRQDDLQRSGVSTLAEALRLAEGIDVARVNGSTWGITTRGFNISSANKLLVLVDGRPTYSPLFGGTFWDVQDALLGDLDRIEVIRGPGGAIWGPNAINGVVNIISRPAAETQGTILTLLGGTNERAVASARYGGQAGGRFYRVYAKYRQRGPQLLASGGTAGDEIAFGQSGFRLESQPNASTVWFTSGAVYRGSLGFLDRDDGRTSGGHMLARVMRRTGPAGEFTLQAYYDHSSRRIPLQFTSGRDTGEIDVQQTARTGRHALVFGSMFRLSDTRDRGIAAFAFVPERETSWIGNAFVQDEIELLPERVYVSAGTKLGRNNVSGLEFQPSARLRLHAGDGQMFWGSISRALRLPTRLDTDLQIFNPATGALVITGSERFDAESVVAVEGGYRALVHPRISVDAAVFTNRYDRLRSQEVEFRPDPVTVLGNMLNARTSGFELATAVQAAPRWRIRAHYSWLHKRLWRDPGSSDPTEGAAEGNDPSHLAGVRSAIDLPRRVSLDATWRYVGERPLPLISAYAELDLRLGWMPRPQWELSLVGQNLLHPAHAELTAGGPREEFRRAVFLRSIWRF